MRGKIYLLAGIPLFFLLAACGSGGVEIPSATTTLALDTPTPPPTATLAIDQVPIESIQDIEWQLITIVQSQPPSETAIQRPDQYTLVFFDDDTFSFRADCNTGSGSYLVEADAITLQPEMVSMAACEPGSLHDPYIASLGAVSSFGVRDGQLRLRMEGGQGELVYRNGGAPQPTPTQTATPVACQAGIDPASVLIETYDLADSTIANCIFGTAYDPSQTPAPVGLPDHIAIRFGVEDVQPGDPVIYLIPVDAYEALWDAAEDESVSESITTLKGLLADKPEPVPTTGVPILPYEEVRGTPDLQVQGRYHEILMGEGIRFVTRFSQGPNPVVRDDPSMVYTFQGLSLDGAYLIAFFFPVTSPMLQPSEEITEEEFAQADSDPPAYLAEKTEELNELSSSDWEPKLSTLDAVIASLQYQTQPINTQAAADRATPPAPGSTIFSDDFSVNRGWYTDESERASFEYKGGAYQITNNTFLANIWSVRSLRRADVGQQVNVQSREGVGYYGVVCRHSDDGNDYYALTMGYDGFYGIGLNKAGDFRFLAEGTDDSEVIDRTPGAVNTLRGDCIGDELTLYINGRRMLTIEDDTLETGEVGFLNGTGAQPGQVVRYDDYTVFEP